MCKQLTAFVFAVPAIADMIVQLPVEELINQAQSSDARAGVGRSRSAGEAEAALSFCCKPSLIAMEHSH